MKKCNCCGRTTDEYFCRECGSDHILIKQSMECIEDKMNLLPIGFAVFAFAVMAFCSAIAYVDTGKMSVMPQFIFSSVMAYGISIPWRIVYKRWRINEERKFVMILAGPRNG
jgi:hypothetical protein